MDMLFPFPDDPYAVRSLVLNPPMTDDELEQFCLRNDMLRIERTRAGEITIISPAGMKSSGGNAWLGLQFGKWWEAHEQDFAFDSSGGFYLTDGSMLSPDVSYLTAATLAKVPEDRREKFPYICPDFVIELISQSDTLADSKRKMVRWLENGVQLGWLIHPRMRQVFIYTMARRNPEIITGGILEGTGPVQGFKIDIDAFWRRFA